MSKVLLVIPLYNEAKRLDFNFFRDLAETLTDQVEFLFFDDGSIDTSATLIEEFCNKCPNFFFFNGGINRGKGEAIRLAFLQNRYCGYVGLGFLDSDSSLSQSDVVRGVSIFLNLCVEEGDFDAYWGSRLEISGRQIFRSRYRHVLGRLISKVSTFGLGRSPWDTQAGFKIFSNSQTFHMLLQEPFHTRWLFEIEILQRIKRKSLKYRIWEEPLISWRDVPGSRIDFRNMIRILGEVLYVLIQNLILNLTERKNCENT